MGRKKLPFYRLVAIDARKRREGLEIERLGWYNPVPNEFSCDLNEDRILHWLNQGAQPSETVDGLFRRMGLKYKWHLIQQGTKDNEIEKLLEEWKKNQAKKAELKTEKKKMKKVAASSTEEAKEEAPAEAAAEETKEEAPAEAAAEEEKEESTDE